MIRNTGGKGPDESASSSRRLAVITGATSGIGRAFANYFAAADYDLILTGRRRAVIQQVAEELERKNGVTTEVVIADLSREEDVSLLMWVIGRRKNIEVLINNAGYGTHHSFSEGEIDHQLDMLKVHVDVPIRLIHKVLPAMKANRSGIIINVSSLAANFPVAGNAMYTGTKSFLKNFTESLHMEVSGYGIQVQCLCPGFTHTQFHQHASFPAADMKHPYIPWMEPSAVVEYSIDCLRKGQVVCIPGLLNRSVNLLANFIPRNLYYQLAVKMEKKFRKPQHMPGFAVMQAVDAKPVRRRW